MNARALRSAERSATFSSRSGSDQRLSLHDRGATSDFSPVAIARMRAHTAAGVVCVDLAQAAIGIREVAQEVRYLLFDVESVADGELIAKTRYAGRELTAKQAIRKFRNELLIDSGRDFIPYTFHLPIAVVIAKLRADYSLVEIVSLDQPLHRPHVITKHFWTGWEAYEQPTWVTFNGRSFDIPLMEHAAFRYGVPSSAWFNLEHRSFEQRRNRYNLQSHIDLHDVLTNYGATWYRGGLNLAASLLGKPGKMDVQGDMVYDLYRQGRIEEINEYCRCDVLDTYFVFLRTMLLMGKLTLEEEQQRVQQTKQLLESQVEAHPAYRQYLEQWGDWTNPWGEATTAADR